MESDPLLSPNPSHAAPSMTGAEAGIQETADTLRKQDLNVSGAFLYFLRTFRLDDADSEPFYLEQANEILQTPRESVFRVRLPHMLQWRPEHVASAGTQLYTYIKKYFLRIFELLEDKLQVFLYDLVDDPQSHYTTQKRYFLGFDDSIDLVHSVRDLKCDTLGELVSVRGQVTRISDVRPELRIASFQCNECQSVIRDIHQAFKYTLPTKCSSPNCSNRTDWRLLLDQCIFGDWQKIRLQEVASESGSGAMPRSIDVIARCDIVDKVHAGDRVIVTGCTVAIPDLPSLMKPGEVPWSIARNMHRKNESSMVSQGLTGIKGVGVRDLGHKLAFLACKIESMNFNSQHTSDTFDSQEVTLKADDIWMDPVMKELVAIAEADTTIDLLANAVAPRVWGYSDIKKGLLLLMVGGVSKVAKSTKLRGDINMCIVGDPSTAKSQMLKFVEEFAPRAVFTSGKGSTAAGLTAAVHRDPDQGDYVLEAGALMYADQGICCIDEFDKMDEKDRTAIHEAMEQQTISITKAGIQATLNARASVLAACNPKLGRYDPSLTFSQNVNIPSPLLSRFDLFFTMLDRANESHDRMVAEHLLKIHRGDNVSSQSIRSSSLSTDELRLYIEIAKRLKPVMTDDAKNVLVNFYVSLRNEDIQPGSRRSLRITVRQLESLVRLSEAVARLKFSDYVTVAHVSIAAQIFKASLQKISNDREIQLEEPEGSLHGGEGRENYRIRFNEYEKISAILLDRVREAEQIDPSGIVSSELIEWCIGEVLHVNDVAEATNWCYKLQKIVERMIEQDSQLLGDVTESSGQLRLRVHPNYGEWPTACVKEQKNKVHSDYGYKSFQESNQTETELTGFDFKVEDVFDNELANTSF